MKSNFNKKGSPTPFKSPVTPAGAEVGERVEERIKGYIYVGTRSKCNICGGRCDLILRFVKNDNSEVILNMCHSCLIRVKDEAERLLDEIYERRTERLKEFFESELPEDGYDEWEYDEDEEEDFEDEW